MLRISDGEYAKRISDLQYAVARADLDLFLVSSFDSIYYLTGAGFEPLERPYFLLISAHRTTEPVLLLPKLDAEHMKQARNVDDIRSYSEYPRLLDAAGPIGFAT